ncbi:hypothetical protein GE061_015220 [Apolygus lucorum]|uniref:Uncharacterized protein n=1 Tax=Apolygus lucorum TaxID=248454 RepID=A0A6A4IQ47_APOLU|nr:hypothetical protein GE061_015220 [Apolygus lucorum]
MKTDAIFKIVAMVLMIVSLAFIVIKHKHFNMPLASLVVTGSMIIYIVFVVGVISGNSVDGELTQFWDILLMGAFIGYGLIVTMGNTNTSGDDILIMISGILCIVTSVILLLDAIFTS